MKTKLLVKKEHSFSFLRIFKQSKLLIAFVFTLFLQTGFAQVTISPWKMNKGGGAINFNLPNHGDPTAYTQMNIPSPSDPNWTAAPTDANGAINYSVGSILSNCLGQLDFTYFQTSINIPTNFNVTDLTVSFSAADDGARAYIFNSTHPSGAFIGEIRLGQTPVTANYASLAKAGEVNRLVIVQFDDCPSGNNLTGAQVKVNGQVVAVSNGGCTQSNFFWSNPPAVRGKTASGTINGVAYTYTSTVNVRTTNGLFAHSLFPTSFNVPNSNPTIQNIEPSNNTLTFASPMTNPVLVFSSIGGGPISVPINFSAPVEVLWSTSVGTGSSFVQNSPTQITGKEGYAIVRMNGTFSSISFDYLVYENYVNFVFGADFLTSYPDTVAPTITLNGQATETVNLGTTYTDPGATAADNCSTATVITGGSVDTNTPGIYTLTYDAVDASGNAATQVSRTVTVVGDITPPTVVTKNITVYLDTNGIVTITPQQIDNGSSDDSGSLTLSLGVGQGSFTCVNVGANTVNLIATDAHGNSASAPAIVTVVDNLAPVVITQNLTIELDEDGLASIVPGQIDNGSTDNCSFTLTLDKTDFTYADLGPNTVILTSIDPSGNTTSAPAIVTLTDVFAPTVITQDITVYLDASGNAIITPQQIDNGSSDPSGPVVLSLDKSNFGCAEIGANSVLLTVTDSSNNSASATATVTVVDNMAPIITAPADISVFATSALGAVVNYTTPVGTDNCSVTTVMTAGLADGSTFPLGVTAVTYTATDASGNTSSASFNVEVVGIAPVINCPANITVSNDLGQCAALVNYTATETVGIPASVITYDIAPGSSFVVGTTTVTATATNAVGTSSCTFTVTVNDTELPTVITQAVTATITNGVATITADQVNNGSTDNCGIASVAVSPSTFVCGDQGNHTVTLTVTDIHGNSATQTAVVTILGDVPTISVNTFTAVPTQASNTIFLGYGPQSMTLNTTTTGGSGFTYNWTSSTGELVASVANPTVSPKFSTTYTVTVTNANGCQATSSIDICVIDARAIDNKGKYEGKVLVCHQESSGNDDDDHSSRNGSHTIEISVNAVEKHLKNHGDTLGACGATCTTSYVDVIVDNDDDDDDDDDHNDHSDNDDDDDDHNDHSDNDDDDDDDHNDHSDNDDDKGKDDHKNGKDDHKSKESKTKAIVYPNPVVDEVGVGLSEKGEGSVEIYDSKGNRIYKKDTKDLKKGIKFSMKGKKTGTYYAKVTCKGKVYTATIFKER